MKTVLKAIIAGASASVLFAVSAFATSQTVNDSGTMVPSMNHSWQNATFITTTATTAVNSSGSMTAGYSAGGGANTIGNSGSGTIYAQWSMSSSGVNSGSASASGLPADTYKVTHGVNGFPDGFSWTFSTTLTW